MLKELFNKHNSDKGFKHRYDLLYDIEFQNLRNNEINFLEIGILGGSSIKSWLDYFPNAKIYAIDIIDKEKVEILNHPRVTYLQHDSTNDLIKHEIKKWNVKFDIIVEDGFHSPDANQKTFENLYEFLKVGGNYYIEDFFPIHIMVDDDYTSRSGKWVRKKKERWSIEKVNKFLSFISKFNYEIFDNRRLTKEQDSFIFKITK